MRPTARRFTTRKVHGWLVVVAALALTAVAVHPALAGVEFVAPVGNCTRVDKVGDGKDLFIMAGLNVQFRVFGNSVDLSNRQTGFRIATDSGAGDVRARIVSQGRDCGGTGFSLVEVDSPRTLTSNIQRSLFFKMPLGDESRLQMTIKAFPSIDVQWTSGSSALNCIVKTGSFEKLNQDKTIRITLPPGHRQDETTCNQRTLTARVAPSNIGEVDIGRTFTYGVTGLPAFMTSNQPLGATSASAHPQISFPIDVARIRGLTAASNSTITIASPNENRTTTLRLEVRPSALANGFIQTANCRNLQTGGLVNVNDLVQCELRLAAPPPAAGQVITFEALDRLCVQSGAPVPAGTINLTYAAASGIGTATLTGPGTIFELPLRALGGTTSAGTPCAGLQSPVQHTVKFWIGVRDIESGADFTQGSFRIRQFP